jgi:hypothetical protein
MGSFLAALDALTAEAVPAPILSQATPEPVVEAHTPTAEEKDLKIPPSEAYRHQGMRYQLIYEGVCTHCAHCGQPLTDSESTERGLGPICSRKGYHEEVESPDSMDALMALAPYPTLVQYLTDKYKPKGNRGLCNGLVRTASLNRRTPVHAACTDAIEALGYKKLASALRESLSVVEIFDSKVRQDSYGIWIKKSDFNWNFYNEIRKIDGVFMSKYPQKEIVVPKTYRAAIAQLLIKYYEGLCVKTDKGAYKITQAWFKKASAA